MTLNPDLLDLIYDVPLGNSQWVDVLKKLRDELQAGLSLMYVFPPNGQPIIFATEPEDDVIWDAYHSQYWELDPWESAIKAQNAFNVMKKGESMLDFNAFQKTTFFNDYWYKWGFKYTAGGYVKAKTVEFIIGIPRLKWMAAYTDEEIRLFNYYVSHIRRALDLEGISGHSLPNYFYESALSSQFGLTGSEASLAMALVKYDGLKFAADSLKRNYNTSKTQLASIFRKTQTSSQMELLKVLLNKAHH